MEDYIIIDVLLLDVLLQGPVCVVSLGRVDVVGAAWMGLSRCGAVCRRATLVEAARPEEDHGRPHRSDARQHVLVNPLGIVCVKIFSEFYRLDTWPVVSDRL